MPFPIFFSEIQAASTDTIQSAAGSVQNVSLTRYYFMVTGQASATNGQSFLKALTDLLNASSGGTPTWTVTLTSTFRIKFSHNGGSPVNLTIDRGLAYMLGLGGVNFTPGSTITFSVPNSTGSTLQLQNAWSWTPDMLVSDVGPALFDPTTNMGIQSAAGSAARSPDQTASYVTNGSQLEATFFFKGVQPYYKVHPIDTDTVHWREDFTTWWYYGPRLGRRILYWKNRSQVVGVTSFALGGNNAAADYWEYYPQPALRAAPTFVPTAPPNLVYWDVTLALWGTERGITRY